MVGIPHLLSERVRAEDDTLCVAELECGPNERAPDERPVAT